MLNVTSAYKEKSRSKRRKQLLIKVTSFKHRYVIGDYLLEVQK